jgi:DNA-binding NarL/FixJ family response regulator
VITAIDEVMDGRTYVCSEIKDFLFEQSLNKEPAQMDIKSLSIRELEIVALLVKGYSSKEIANDLFISPRTAEVHRHNILKKLRLKNTASLISFINNNDITL